MRNDALYVYHPRWLEESGLPEELNQKAGPLGWSVFKKLLEIDCERNVFPGWVAVTMAELSRWCGIDEETARITVEKLIESERIRYRPLSETADSDEYSIATPLETPLDDKEIRERLKARGWSVKPLRFRYGAPGEVEDAFQYTQNLYHEVFGARMNPNIASDLREIAENFELYRIREVFEAAKRERVKSLSWVLTQLYRGERTDFIGPDRGGPEKPRIAARYELEDR